MKTTLNSRQIRCIKVANPPQKEIKKTVEKANEVTRTALSKMMFPEIYTR